MYFSSLRINGSHRYTNYDYRIFLAGVLCSDHFFDGISARYCVTGRNQSSDNCGWRLHQCVFVSFSRIHIVHSTGARHGIPWHSVQLEGSALDYQTH